jgi:hypothetical protein
MTATWTTPRTWATGEVVTESMLNTHVRDNLEYVKEHIDASEDVHGAPTGGHMLATLIGAGRHVAYESVTLTGTGASNEKAEASGTWDTAFSTACHVAIAGVLDAGDIFAGRCSVSLRSFSTTGFTAKAGLQYMTGNITVYVLGLGY